ncbi:MAG: ATP-binding protein [Defluviitaleaceae bacterium]|nr:ATP-binding protein [Defluviitaleaceae bacterium]
MIAMIILSVLFALSIVFCVILLLHIKKIKQQSIEIIKQADASQDLLHTIMDTAPFTISFWDSTANIIRASSQTEKYYEISNRDYYIQHFADFSPQFQPDGSPSVSRAKELILGAFRDGYTRFEWMHQTASGEPLPTEVVAVKANYQGKNVVIAYTNDMRRVKAALQTEANAHALTGVLVNSAPYVMNLWDKDIKLIRTSHKALEMFKVDSREEYIDLFFELSPKYQPCGRLSDELVQEKLEQVYKYGFVKFEWMHCAKDGEELPSEVTLVTFEHNGEKMMVGYITDLRPIKQAMQNEREALEMTTKFLEFAPYLYNLWDEHLNLIDVGRQTMELFDVPNKEYYINNYRDFWPERQPCGTESYVLARKFVAIAIKKGRARFEWVNKNKNGDEIPVEVTLVHFVHRERNLIAAFIVDLRPIREAIKRELEANDLNEMLLRGTPLMTTVWDEKHNLLSANQQIIDIMGVSSEEELVERMAEFQMDPQPCGTSHTEKAAQYIQTALKDGHCRFEWWHITSDGEPLPVDVHLVRFMRRGSPMLVSYASDLREIKSMLEELDATHQSVVAAEEKAQLLLQEAPAAITVYDNNLQAIDCNAQAVTMFLAANKDEYLDNVNTYMPQFQPDGTNSYELHRELIKQALREGRSRSELICERSDGSLLSTEVVFARVHFDEYLGVIEYTTDLTEIKEAHEKQRASDEESRAKTRFLAHMSHEIRTPMNAVLGIAEMQLQRNGHTPETEEAFMRIHASSNLLLTIINDILDLSKVEAGKLEIVPFNYETASFIVDTVQLNLMHIGSKSIKFTLNIDENLPTNLFGDETRIKQILNNLMSNAFKYTLAGQVVLTVCREECDIADNVMLVMRISDTGQGMTQEQINSLFEIDFARFNNFTRFNIKANRYIEGSGLGLTIARQLIEMMGGTMHIDSKPNTGSIFTVRIPQQVAGVDVLGAELAQNLQNLETTTSSLRRMRDIVLEPMPYGRVLVVDDVDSNIYVIKGFLQPYKIAVDSVENGQSAVNKIKNGEVYDIIFMDHMMPVMDGIEATQIIREFGYTEPIVALTANALVGAREQFLNNGFDGFIAKPIDFHQLNSYLEKYIRDKQTPDVLAAARKTVIAKIPQPLENNAFTRSFVRDAQKAIKTIAGIIESRNLDDEKLRNFAIAVHGMKGALLNIDNINLSDIADKLEKAANNNDLGTITTKTPEFLKALKQVLENITPNDEQDICKCEYDIAKFNAKIKELLIAISDFDITAIDNTFEELQNLPYPKHSKEALIEIEANLLRGDYDNAASIVKTLIP